MFGGPAWTRVGDGQWYLHLFTPEQPDLNWANRDVRADFLRTLRFWSDRGVDGFRVDVAHGLAKDLTEPLPSQAELATGSLAPGAHPFWDRDEVHDIFAEWRQVFDEYTPPRMGVAEAWVDSARLARYASQKGLGQAFSFDLVEADWDAGQFRAVIVRGLAQARLHGATTTWVLSNHDVVRHATRYGLPADRRGSRHAARSWLRSDGTSVPLDRELGRRRARAATLLMLALPGSAYLYQGEELGLHEVGDLPAAVLADPVYRRTGGADKGRDGCRVPLPWTAAGPSFGFGSGAAHLPQPPWFAAASVQAQEADPSSTLALYRQALAWRRRLQAAEELDWQASADPDVLHFRRPGGWEVVTNFGPATARLPAGEVVLSSEPIEAGKLAGQATAWVIAR
jgi:alpha-glucosidase